MNWESWLYSKKKGCNNSSGVGTRSTPQSCLNPFVLAKFGTQGNMKEKVQASHESRMRSVIISSPTPLVLGKGLLLGECLNQGDIRCSLMSSYDVPNMTPVNPYSFPKVLTSFYFHKVLLFDLICCIQTRVIISM
jgi:hypothetical protein